MMATQDSVVSVKQKHAPLFLVRKAAHKQFDIPYLFLEYQDVILAGVEFAETLGVAPDRELFITHNFERNGAPCTSP